MATDSVAFEFNVCSSFVSLFAGCNTFDLNGFFIRGMTVSGEKQLKYVRCDHSDQAAI